ncbi:Junctional protein associated with coronary artery disease [Anabarilius grahami]|uniref:Junctional protein associated with coronary artery disease n=1 Tax=Anabarilius grahami TaxID=495550 RepID=A0A3N0YBN7_ANAGA|nr:Junctional protein associated with coronary artery disease [Anabarilius grahami]
MYSVEDLLISHGYKLPRSGPASSSSSAPYDNRNNECRRDNVENRPAVGGGTLNGFGTTEGGAEAGMGVYRPAPVKAYPENNNNINEGHERIQRRLEVPVAFLGDLQPLGDSLATDSGFYDAPSLTFSEHADERDISFWRRRGQDFSALLDYADPRELRVSGGLWRGPVLAVEELRGERPLARWEEGPWIREPIDSGPETLRVTGERKCQSLGTEEWRPAVGLGRQLSDGEAEHWSQEQQHRLRPAEGSVSATVRAKSQSLPRVLSPEDPHYGDLPQTGAPNQPPTQRSNSSAPYGRYHSEWQAGERWSGQTQSHAPSAVVPKPRFSRPVKPPSYETHQQNRGSWETLSSEPVSKPRDRSVCFSQSFEPLRDRSGCYSQSAEPLRDRSICFSQSAEPIRDRLVSHSQSAEPLRDRFVSHSQSAELLRDRFFSHSHSADLLRDRSLCYSQSSELLRDRSICYSQSAELLRPEAYRADLFYHELTGMEPPGYIPPPSYRRFLPPRSGQNYRADSALVRWKREPVSAEMGQWFSRTSGLSWSERREDRSMAVVPRRPVHPGPVIPCRPGLVQYVPFDDPRIRHVSGGPCGNSLTDADKIRHVNKELPCAATLGQSTHDSAFFPSQGPSLSTDTNKPALTEQENTNRWHKGMNKGSETVASDQSCAKYPIAFQPRPLQPIIKTDRSTDQQIRADRVTDQVKVERVTELVKVERGAEQTRTDQVKVTEQVKTDRVTDLIKLDKPTDQVKPDRFTDKQIKVERLTDQIQVDRTPDQVKADRYTDKQIKPEVKAEKIPEKPIKADRISDKQSKAERLLEKHLKIDRILEKQLKADKMLEKQCKSEKFTDKLIKADKQAKGDSNTDQTKAEKITDKSGKADKTMDKGSSESVSTVKTEPVQEPEKKSVKKKLSETIFCLVSVPLSQSSAKSRDQNNNEEKEPDSPPIPPPPPPSSSSENSNTLGSLPNQSLKSTSTTSTDLELQALTLGSGSSSIATRRAHRRRNSRSRIIKPNPHDELRRYSGAWPGDQYRDQETQTSPEPTKSNANPGPANSEAQDAPAAPEVTATAETTSVAPGAAPGALGALTAPSVPSVPPVPPTPAAPPTSGGPDSSTPYGYPMKGQKSLKPSSNSAFSRTGTFSKSTGSHRPPLHPPPHPPPPPPTQPPSQPPPPPPTQPPAQSPPSDLTEEAKSASGPNPEAFGQFLLKPVSRRPWDAIEELETINKEAQDQASKRPSVDQCIEDLNEAYKDILELSTASNNLPNRSSMQIPDRIKSRLSSDSIGIPATTLRPSLVPGSDPEYREVKSAFSRPSTGKSVSFSKQLREEICPAPPPPEPGFRDYKTVMSQITQRKACRSVKLDIPAPKETQRDDDLTAQTSSTSSMSAEVPWADRQPMQDASTLTSPPDYEHICQTLQMARESGAVSRASVKSKPGSAMSIETPQHVPIPSRPPVDSEQPCCSSALEVRQDPVSLFREERSSGFRRVTSHNNRFLNNRGVLCSLATGKPVGDKAGLEANPEVPADWQMQLSLAEKHIATLITGEGSAVDLDESNKVKGDTDITGSESVENELNNILATEMKDDPANTEQKHSEVKETETEQTETPKSQQPEVTEKVTEEDTSREKTEREQEKCELKDPVTEETEQKSDTASEAKKEPNVVLRANKAAMWTHSGLDSELRPEFPPDHLPLSVLPYPNRRLSLGLDWERAGWEGESLGQGGFWSRERRSLDAERWGIGGEMWGLDNDRQEGGGEKRGLGGWRGCGIDGQGTDDSDWELDKNTQNTGDIEADSDTKQKTLKHEQGLGEDQSSLASSTDKVEHTQVAAGEGIDKGRSQGPDEGQVSSVDRRSRGLSQRIEALFTAPPGHGSEERLARMREVDTVSRMRRLSLRSSDSWDGLQGVERWGDCGREEECPLPDSQDSSNITKLEDNEGSSLPAVTSEPKETKDQATLKESQEPSQVERS